MRHVLIIGCGDLGRRIAALHRATGASVTGVVRSAASVARLTNEGLATVLLDLDGPDGMPPLPAADVVHYLAPPPAGGRAEPRLARALAALPPPRRLLYLGTTAVYGDQAGAWVDETTPVAPRADRAWRRLDAERQVRHWCRACDAASVVVRAAAIYGPGRLPLERLRRGATVIRAADAGFANRIHVDDLAAICVAAATRAPDDALYDAADGAPTSTADYYAAVAAHYGLPPPRVVSRDEAAAELSDALLEYAEESKRVRAWRVRRELGVELRYPTLAAGLAAC